MVIIHDNNRVVALAESYAGPDNFMPSPEGFDESRFEEYRLVDGEWVIPAPAVVDMRQARLALLAEGHLATVNAAMTTQSEAAQIEWEYATAVRRDSPLTAAMASVLGLDDTQLDVLFAMASTL